MPTSRGDDGGGEPSSSSSRREEKGKDDEALPSSTSTSTVFTQREPLGRRHIAPPPPVATLLRALASAGEILADGDLRTRAANALRAGVRTAASEAPRRAREAVLRAQKHAADARLARGLAAERESAVDVQVGGSLIEDAPQELRSRMWVAVLEDDSLFDSAFASEGEDEVEGGVDDGGFGVEGDGYEGEGERERNEARDEFLSRSSSARRPPSDDPSPSTSPAPALPVERSGGDATEPWEMVQGSSNLYPLSSSSKLEGIGNREKKEEGTLSDADAADTAADADGESAGARRTRNKRRKKKPLRDRVLEGALSSPWPLPSEYSERGRYNHLVSAPFPPGDDTDDAVGRDIGRTFPEHPQFGYAHGRAALARVLRAAALADPQVGYCQGMAFVAGVLLMYLPEELSFRVLTERLLREQEVVSPEVVSPEVVGPSPPGDGDAEEEGDEEKAGAKEGEEENDAGATAGDDGGGAERRPRERNERPLRPPPAVRPTARIGGAGGAGLRTLYEPGLSGLKSLLAQYEWLLERIAPEVSTRLTELGIPPVLYAAQWMLTAFACPFPPHVAARVLDAVLLERSPAPLVRAAIAVVVELGPSILSSTSPPPPSSYSRQESQSHAADFEAALAVLKVEPPRWPRERARAALSRGLCPGGLVPSGAVEAAAAAVGASAAAEARAEEEGRREREREKRDEEEGQRRRKREEEEERASRETERRASEAAGGGSAAAAPPAPPFLSRLSRDAPSISSLELAFEGLSWSGAAATGDDDDDEGEGAAAAAEASGDGCKGEDAVKGADQSL